MKRYFVLFIILMAARANSQERLTGKEFSVNGFRNPSMGIEHRRGALSFHVGYYITVISKDERGKNETTSFFKLGVTGWFLPTEAGSSMYSSLSFVRGLSKDYKGDNGIMIETGYRWMVWKGLNLRLGATLLLAAGHEMKLNPTPGLSYSFFSK